MMDKKGFIFIETIVTIVVLAVSLLYVYSGFNNILNKEKKRIHYDDVAYIYRTYYVKNFFAKHEINDVLKKLDQNNQPMIVIGCDYSTSLYTDSEFQYGYNYAKEFFEANNHLNVPADYIVDGYQLGKFIKRQNIAYNNGQLPQERINRLNSIGMVWSNTVQYDGIFGDSEDSKILCENLVNNLHITSIVVALNDLSYIQDCDLSANSLSDRCAYLKNLPANKVNYLETLGKLGAENKYVMIIEYAEAEEYFVEDNDSEFLVNNKKERITYNYAWVRI